MVVMVVVAAAWRNGCECLLIMIVGCKSEHLARPHTYCPRIRIPHSLAKFSPSGHPTYHSDRRPLTQPQSLSIPLRDASLRITVSTTVGCCRSARSTARLAPHRSPQPSGAILSIVTTYVEEFMWTQWNLSRPFTVPSFRIRFTQ